MEIQWVPKRAEQSDGQIDGQTLLPAPHCEFMYTLFDNNEPKRLKTFANLATRTFSFEKYAKAEGTLPIERQ